MTVFSRHLQKMLRVMMLIAGGMMLVSTPVLATQIVTGTLYETQTNYGNTVDHWLLTVNTSGTVIFDVLSYENTADVTELDATTGGHGTDVDVNNDNEYAYFDSAIILGQYTGSGIVLVDGNDDNYDNSGTADGSIILDDYGFSLDSYLSLDLSAGNYLLMVGTWNVGLDGDGEFDGHLDNYFNAFLSGEVAQGSYSTLRTDGGLASDHGDYQVTITGDINMATVPEPATLLMLCSGLVCLGVTRRKPKLMI